MNLSSTIARGNTAVPACHTQCSMTELFAASESHAQCPISRHTAALCCHQASHSTLLTNSVQMLGLLKESEFTLAARPKKLAFQTDMAFFFCYC